MTVTSSVTGSGRERRRFSWLSLLKLGVSYSCSVFCVSDFEFEFNTFIVALQALCFSDLKPLFRS